jgi:hypothetical protein
MVEKFNNPVIPSFKEKREYCLHSMHNVDAIGRVVYGIKRVLINSFSSPFFLPPPMQETLRCPSYGMRVSLEKNMVLGTGVW